MCVKKGKKLARMIKSDEVISLETRSPNVQRVPLLIGPAGKV